MLKDHDPPHKMIDRPWDYEIAGFTWSAASDTEESCLDVTFRKGSVVRRLRFLSPEDVRISLTSIHPAPGGDMEILDVSGRQLEGKKVRVHGSGASGSPICLWARDVIDLDRPS